MWKLGSAILALGLSLSVAATELVIETWRVDDAALWKEQILPRFQAKYPDITLVGNKKTFDMISNYYQICFKSFELSGCRNANKSFFFSFRKRKF